MTAKSTNSDKDWTKSDIQCTRNKRNKLIKRSKENEAKSLAKKLPELKDDKL